MAKKNWLTLTATIFLASIGWADEQGEGTSDSGRVMRLLRSHCVKCHGAESPDAEFAIEPLTGKVAKEASAWEKIHEMLSLGLMPHAREMRPAETEMTYVIRWIESQLAKVGRAPDPLRLQMPAFGNRVSHEALFSGAHKGPSFSYSRLWRLSPEIYAQMAKDKGIVRHTSAMGLADAMADALAPLSDKGIQDYALLRADEATLRTLVNSSRTIAIRMTVGRVIPARRRGKNPGKARIDKNNRVFRDLKFLDGNSASDEELSHALDRAFEELLQRKPAKDERARFGDFLRHSVDRAGPMLGFQNLVMALLMSPEFIFRMELGLGTRLSDGRRMLAPQEIAFALAYALTDRPPDKELLTAAINGKLVERSDVAREARRFLGQYDAPHTYFTVPMEKMGTKSRPYNTRPLRFFREFFGYHKATTVFKDDQHRGRRRHEPKWLVEDADRFVLEILERDKHVFRELLTSDRYFAAYVPPNRIDAAIKRMLNSKRKGKDKKAGKKAAELEARIKKGIYPVPRPYGNYVQAYNLDESTWAWQKDQPFKVAHRAGMLTHPAWLVAHSGNFDNDPIRRGKWIREHLLAGSVPDLPIGVEAKLPEDPHKTLRQRMKVTQEATCWRCHRLMNPLGLPFEQYDDFGRFRKKIVLVREQQKRGRVTVPRVTRPVDSSGELDGTGESQLDGPVTGAHDLIERLAKSDRVRQSILRHVFRYWMGRNEMLSDSPTLMAMDKAYLESDGSFKEVLVTLLTSDSFLYRRDKHQAADSKSKLSE